MSAWLSSWLKDIILVILLAAFIDLLLPNSSMQRYVKVVISLFILTTILSPLVGSLFKTDFEKTVFTAYSGTVDDSLKQLKPLAQIMSDGERLKEENNRRSTEMVAQEIAAMAKKQIEEELHQPVDQVQVNIEQKQGESPQIKEMNIVLSGQGQPDDKQNRKQPGNNEVSPVHIEPVKPVNIRVQVGDSLNENEAVPVAAASGQSGGETESIRSIKAYLQQQWKISSGQIHIQIAD